ncbi:hypothetical protein FOZ60_010552 [Perkinsus olseni]|uniref:Uncharacterized protein n=1 Tax=Perkinsus olseni TaxID=32597 RepID=A0A7J6NF40_PEROL|nr:hypothetical protein FOZ60_010552 [Perkinsus olseni]
MEYLDIEAVASSPSQPPSGAAGAGRYCIHWGLHNSGQLSNTVYLASNIPNDAPLRASPDYSCFYLITWSHPCDGSESLLRPELDLTKADFGKVIQEAFKEHDVPLLYFCVASEKHSDSKTHYHAATRSSRRHRWRRIARWLLRHRVAVGFKAFKSYLASYKYCVKEDVAPFLSEGHPPYPSEPLQRELRIVDEKQEAGEGCKIRRLSDIAGWVVSRKLKTEREFLAAASKEKNLKSFILDHRDTPGTMLKRIWGMESAERDLIRASKSRMQILEETADSDVCACNGVTSSAIETILTRNEVPVHSFVRAIRRTLINGRSRNHNLMLAGPSACGKSYLIKHISVLFKAVGLSSGSYPLAILDECKPEIFVLDDFRVYQQQAGFAISDCLCFLEGKTPFVVPLPKTSNRADVLYYDDAPVIATVPGPFNCRHLSQEENRMLNERFAWITLNNPIPIDRRVDLPPCGSCFAKLILSYND